MPAYYNSINFSQTGNNLKDQLAQLITTTHTHNLVYTPEVWDALEQTDLVPGSNQNVFLIYGYNDNDADDDNDRTRSKYLTCHSESCDGKWVREHVFPRSLGSPNLEFDGPGSDAHHLRAIDYDMNNDRGNKRFGPGSGNAATVTGGYFYPGDEWKGDIARMMMYMYVRYKTQCRAIVVGAGSATYNVDMPNIFLEWNKEDPVSQYEKNRNTILQNMQGNRNPFIDNPYLATLIWGGPAAQNTWSNLSSPDFALNNIAVYPTLTTGEIHIENTASEHYTYSVYNNLGQQVKSVISDNTVDITGNTPGLYFLIVTNDNSNKTFKIILK
jgi:endonuclease I